MVGTSGPLFNAGRGNKMKMNPIEALESLASYSMPSLSAELAGVVRAHIEALEKKAGDYDQLHAEYLTAQADGDRARTSLATVIAEREALARAKGSADHFVKYHNDTNEALGDEGKPGEYLPDVVKRMRLELEALRVRVGVSSMLNVNFNTQEELKRLRAEISKRDENSAMNVEAYARIHAALDRSGIQYTGAASGVEELAKRFDESGLRSVLAALRKVPGFDPDMPLSEFVVQLVERFLADPAPGTGPYSMGDVQHIQIVKGKPYARLEATVKALEAARAEEVDLMSMAESLGMTDQAEGHAPHRASVREIAGRVEQLRQRIERENSDRFELDLIDDGHARLSIKTGVCTHFVISVEHLTEKERSLLQHIITPEIPF